VNEAAYRIADARAAIDLVAAAGLSLTLRARAGPVRDALLDRLAAARAVLRITADADVSVLAGGVDAMASVAVGAPVWSHSLAERIDGRVLVVAGAERIGATLAGLLARMIDRGEVAGLVLIDEGDTDEVVPAMLADRVAMLVDTEGLSWRDLALEAAAEATGPAPDEMIGPLCEVAAAFGIASLRAPGHALAVARALPRPRESDSGLPPSRENGVMMGDLERAVRLTLALRARQVPGAENAPEQQPDAPQEEQDQRGDGGEAADRLLDAAKVALPPGLLEAQGGHSMGAGTTGSTDARTGQAARGRGGRVRKAMPRGGARLDLVATLIAAAPMQRLRGRAAGAPLAVRRDDVRVRRPVPQRRRATIFAVDASGSAAVARLAEVKGAVEQLLGESYVRRDEVGLIAFRGTEAETLLAPTRSLARARRELAALPGGGATPLAAGIAAGLDQAIRSQAAGRAPLLVVLTDGGANIARDGTPGREAARADAEAIAKRVAAARIPALVIDSAPRGEARVRALASAMAARYVALPRADDRSLARAVGEAR
jgi:magnesium chelatase subunit D